jgi:hypothetical protein
MPKDETGKWIPSKGSSMEYEGESEKIRKILEKRFIDGVGTSTTLTSPNIDYTNANLRIGSTVYATKQEIKNSDVLTSNIVLNSINDISASGKEDKIISFKDDLLDKIIYPPGSSLNYLYINAATPAIQDLYRSGSYSSHGGYAIDPYTQNSYLVPSSPNIKYGFYASNNTLIGSKDYLTSATVNFSSTTPNYILIDAGTPSSHYPFDKITNEIFTATTTPSVFSGYIDENNNTYNKINESKNYFYNQDKFLQTIDLNRTSFNLDLEDIYTSSKSWTELQRDAGISTLEPGPNEEPLLRAVGRLLHADDPDRLATYKLLADSETAPDLANMPIKDKRYLRMLIASLVDQVVGRDASLEECIELLWQNPQVLKELSALFEYLTTRVSHLAKTVDQLSDVPLSIHARYTRIEILAAFGVGNNARTPTWREGVLWANEAKADLIVFTLDKTSGHFSPTTRYRDYAISRDLIHWESQAGTRAESNTGKRYQNHAEQGSRIFALGYFSVFTYCDACSNKAFLV